MDSSFACRTLGFLGIVGAGFLSEDGATVTAAALAASHSMDPCLAFLGAFVGLWAGDLGVYALARRAGPAALRHRWLARWQEKAQGTSQRNATARLGFSRFLPGTRLPSYVAAGLNRMPLLRFAGITAGTALIWTTLLFALIRLAPAHSGVFGNTLAAAGATSLILFGMLWAWRVWGDAIASRFVALFTRITRWEFWPAWLFYIPVVCFCLWLAIRYRGLALPAVANLNQKHGGLVGESKAAILRELTRTSPELTLEAWLIRTGPRAERIAAARRLIEQHRVTAPFVMKPDIAQRGAGFKKINSAEEMERYLTQVDVPIVLQRYAPGPREAGIFYYRFPDERAGHILGITRKVFPEVVGDGLRTLRELIRMDSRAKMIASTYLTRFASQADRVLRDGERFRLVEAGNHCQGCEFQDGSDLYSDELRDRLDVASQKLKGFFVGRFDVRYSRDEDLRAGRDFQVVELNGAASEATNVYDARNSLWSAYRILFQQWKIVYAIGATNRRRGYRPSSALSIWRDWQGFLAESCSFPVAD